MRESLTRRRLVIGTGTILAGGSALAATHSEPAAGLQVSGLDVSDASTTLGPNGGVSKVRLDISVDYDYAASHQPTTITAAAFVAPSASGSYDELDALTLSDPAKADSGTVSLSADLLDTDAFDAADFEAAEGATTTQDVAVKVVFTILRDGTRIGLADISDVAQVAVSREELTVSASIAGTGTLSVQTS